MENLFKHFLVDGWDCFSGDFISWVALAIVALTKSKNVESMFFNYLLVCLAIFDNLYLSNGILGAIRKYIIASSYIFDYVFINLIFPTQGISVDQDGI